MSDPIAQGDGFVATFRDGKLHGMRIEAGDKRSDVIKMARTALGADTDMLTALSGQSAVERAVDKVAAAVIKMRSARSWRPVAPLPLSSRSGYRRLW